MHGGDFEMPAAMRGRGGCSHVGLVRCLCRLAYLNINRPAERSEGGLDLFEPGSVLQSEQAIDGLAVPAKPACKLARVVPADRSAQ